MAAWLESGAALGSLGLDLAGVGVHGEEVARRSDPCGCVYDGFGIWLEAVKSVRCGVPCPNETT